MTQKPSSKAICHTDKMYVELNLNYEVPIKSSKQSEIWGCTTHELYVRVGFYPAWLEEYKKYQYRITLPETNKTPETLGLEDEFPFWEDLLPGAMLGFGSVSYPNSVRNVSPQTSSQVCVSWFTAWKIDQLSIQYSTRTRRKEQQQHPYQPCLC